MIKNLYGVFFALFIGYSNAQAVTFSDSQFEVRFGTLKQTVNDLSGSWDGTLNTSETDTNFNMSLVSNLPVFGLNFTLHHIRVFGLGQYTFDTGCSAEQLDNGINSCGGIQQDVTITEGQIGAHILFDYGDSVDVDFFIVWEKDQTYDGGAITWDYASIDGDGDGFPGMFIVDEVFSGLLININLSISDPGIFITAEVPNGNPQECVAHGGNEHIVTLSSVLPENDAIDSVVWLLDGEYVGDGISQQLIFFPLGEHSLQVDIATVNGGTATETQTVTVTDRTDPELSADLEPVRKRNHKHKRKGVEKFTLVTAVSDICDPEPVIIESVMGLDVEPGASVNIKRNKGRVLFETDEITLYVVAEDESKNRQSVFRRYPISINE